MLLVDEYTRKTKVLFLGNKSEAFKQFNIYKEMFKTDMDLKIKCLIYKKMESLHQRNSCIYVVKME
jgi:hypothetical protein